MKSVKQQILHNVQKDISWRNTNGEDHMDYEVYIEIVSNTVLMMPPDDDIIDHIIDGVVEEYEMKMEQPIDLSMMDRLAEQAELIREGLTTRLSDDQGWEWVPIYASPFDWEHESDDYPYDEIPSERVRTLRIDTDPAIIIRMQANKDDMTSIGIEFTEEGGRLRASCGCGSRSKDKQANVKKAVDHAIAFISGKLESYGDGIDYGVEFEPCDYGDLARKDFANLTSWLLTWRPENVIASPRVNGL